MLDFLKHFFASVTYSPSKKGSDCHCEGNSEVCIQTWEFEEIFTQLEASESFHVAYVPYVGESQICLNASNIRDYFDRLAQEYDEIAVVDPAYFKNGKLDNQIFEKTKTLRTKLKSAEIIFCPIHQDNHWYLSIIEKCGDNIFCIKSLDGFNRFSRHVEFNQQVRDLLKLLYGETELTFIDPEHFSYPIPKQNNAYDCGVVICHYASKFMQGDELEWYEQFSNEHHSYNHLRSTYYLTEKDRLPQSAFINPRVISLEQETDDDVQIIEPPQQSESGSPRRPILVR